MEWTWNYSIRKGFFTPVQAKLKKDWERRLAYPHAADAKTSPHGQAQRQPQLPVERHPGRLGVLDQHLFTGKKQ